MAEHLKTQEAGTRLRNELRDEIHDLKQKLESAENTANSLRMDVARLQNERSEPEQPGKGGYKGGNSKGKGKK